MSNLKLQTALDTLNEMWRKFENALLKLPFVQDELPLSIQRVGSIMRVCYKNCPVGECSAAEKIEAATFLAKLLDALENRDNYTLVLAENAAKLVAAAIERVTPKESQE